MVAEACAGQPERITIGQAKAILAAAQWVGLSAHHLATFLLKVTGAERTDQITRAGFADSVYGFVVDGLPPSVSADGDRAVRLAR